MGWECTPGCRVWEHAGFSGYGAPIHGGGGAPAQISGKSIVLGSDGGDGSDGSYSYGNDGNGSYGIRPAV